MEKFLHHGSRRLLARLRAGSNVQASNFLVRSIVPGDRLSVSLDLSLPISAYAQRIVQRFFFPQHKRKKTPLSPLERIPYLHCGYGLGDREIMEIWFSFDDRIQFVTPDGSVHFKSRISASISEISIHLRVLHMSHTQSYLKDDTMYSGETHKLHSLRSSYACRILVIPTS